MNKTKKVQISLDEIMTDEELLVYDLEALINKYGTLNHEYGYTYENNYSHKRCLQLVKEIQTVRKKITKAIHKIQPSIKNRWP
jgi:hypothetical protein